MKKVLVLAAAVALFATPALAAITGTAHDLTAENGGTSNELCVYCHTPHGADTAVTKAPLWNRTNANAAGTLYVGLDIQASYDLASVNQTDAPLCLSCHDGSSLAQVLKNEPNSGTTDLSTYAWASTQAQIGTDLSNDHPIGFDFSVMSATDTAIKTQTNAEASGAKFFGTLGNEMWCSSCHDVHNDGGFAPFLNVTADGSAICLACHIK